ncbi:flagellar hook-basal body complex protein FliE [Mobilisporobacter senegalensis]|uniref:Flagellar hook-basal body complex protein FliE n=1 Tax=Mobilisporobacter senegalensis TaxID=1329262 RepID=A0A3N1XVW3_9FIRM|nr:flagellar hook-basal body complex protein FliE [Mobilisporobacter senegalensis]ROR30760.1 flagellar hook-basal body complex protein FliE [Mobilisporobacter senegalensis]
MNITSIGSLESVSTYNKNYASKVSTTRNESFEALFESALSMINDTNSLTNAAEEEEMKYALGISTNTHDLQIAQSKANTSLQYTVAVRNKVVEAYKEIMSLQF